MSIKWLKMISVSLVFIVVVGIVSVEILCVVIDLSFVLFEMMDQEIGEMIGFDMEIICEVGECVGFDIDFNIMDFNGIIFVL